MRGEVDEFLNAHKPKCVVICLKFGSCNSVVTIFICVGRKPY